MPIPPSVIEARLYFRKTWVPSWYRGWAHFAFTCLWSLTLIAWSLSRIHSPSLAELAIVPFSFVFANLVEYCAHRWPMHHRTRGLYPLFDRHTVLHHAFFTHETMEIESTRDYKMVLFPAFVAVLFVSAVALPVALILRALISANAGYLFFGTGVCYFLNYEWLHWSYHQPAGHWIRLIPGLARSSRRHTRHHDPRLMTQYNFNITYPFFDWIFGTLKGD